MLKLNGKRCARSKKNVTLDNRHKEIITKYEKDRKTIPIKQQRLTSLQAKLATLDPIFDLNRYSEISYEIDFLTTEIANLEDNAEIKKYYSENGHIIAEYYDIPATSGRINASLTDRSIGSNTVLKYIQDQDQEDVDQQTDTHTEINDNESVNTDQTRISAKKNRSDVAKEYFRKVDPEMYQSMNKVDPSRCPTCNIEMTSDVNQGIIFCDECGFTDEAVIDSKKSSLRFGGK